MSDFIDDFEEDDLEFVFIDDEPPVDDNDSGHYLFDADPMCKHEIESLMYGMQCKKCEGWFCY